MTKTWTVSGIPGLLVLVPVTVCATITYVNQDSSRCNDRSNKSFAQCQYDVDCIANAYCRNQQTCWCKENHVPFKSDNIYKCLRVATSIGDPCEEDIQCQFTFTPLSECREGTCQCAHGSHFVEGRCYELVGLGKRCRSHRNCYVKNTFCDYGFCTCGLRYHPNPDNSSCLLSAMLGERCNHDYECIVENSKCIQNKCDCKVDHVLAEDDRRCRKAASKIGQECEQQSQCQLFLKYSQCGVNNTCDCVVGSHKRGFQCFVDVELGGHCETHHHCITGSYKDSNSSGKSKVDCVNGFCACSEGYTLTEELQDCVQFSDNGAARWQTYGIFPIIVLIARLLVR
ncbi:prion-like-(Q/N-rich) domain-bearing protein 25 [Odontomachus brunneus]|uniref:prion-like-(Q/N-rich) domain-bearing protein 25 n=1 Tax=Odontomachus brunneus TaxID=486640 RepID=UPI0013F19598|nr:prion-like-(Q/N-rich) domain-bearing protein 25 [Odontomachus brunneus]XP_032675291.1 prion-like-(Q/N-rich) domain-bearing protein 25 [Odontomachus brunneus]XP_032675292.1 prion-like-(Q/N-rich) domain-bearing protein 25 [Odontomachus brunneus]XP_032675293.1 prion-like-(Q/N-rich) domain-bearing protein 25 [Odontomachus brunneus]XP_032675295.1 prion-like-(Q/N-rich) domain-bearing protein 25 [Odontomachus brunneus]